MDTAAASLDWRFSPSALKHMQDVEEFASEAEPHCNTELSQDIVKEQEPGNNRGPVYKIQRYQGQHIPHQELTRMVSDKTTR